jgi:uncharacterized protein YxjI
MKLYIKQRIFSFGDKYDVLDADENVVFDVESELFTFGSKLHLYNTQGQELYYIKSKLTFILAQYEIYNNNDLCATINQEFALFHSKLSVDSNLGIFAIDGDFMTMNYQITRDGQYFGSISKKWLTWGDSYELDIPDDENAGFFCALVIAIDNCLHNGKKS